MFVTTEGIATDVEQQTGCLRSAKLAVAGGRLAARRAVGCRAPSSFVFQPVQFCGLPLASTRKKVQNFYAARAAEVFYGLQRRQDHCLPLRFYGLRHKTARILAFNSFFGRKNGHYGPNREPWALHVAKDKAQMLTESVGFGRPRRHSAAGRCVLPLLLALACRCCR